MQSLANFGKSLWSCAYKDPLSKVGRRTSWYVKVLSVIFCRDRRDQPPIGHAVLRGPFDSCSLFDIEIVM